MNSKVETKPKAIPTKEIRWVSGVEDGVVKYVITSNPDRTKYNLWEAVNGGYIKISSSNTPVDFDKIMFRKGR